MGNTKWNSRTFDGNNQIEDDDIMVIFDFEKLTIETVILKLGRITDKDGNDEGASSLAFYEKNGKSYLGGMNGNVFTEPKLFGKPKGSNHHISILEKDPNYNEILKIFKWLLDDKLGIDVSTNEFVEFNSQIGIAYISKEYFIKLISDE